MSTTPAPGALIALDQGTSGTKGLLVAADGSVIATAYRPLDQSYPHPGFVEQEPEAIWNGVLGVVTDLLTSQPSAAPLAGLALSAQREAVLAWDADTGKPLSRLISWQDRRTVERCRELGESPQAGLIVERTGLPIDPMFSATKMSWLLDHLDRDREQARAGRLRLGTVDAWLLHRLTDGTCDATEVGCAARTQLLNLRHATWDPDLLELHEVPQTALPQVTPSTGAFGHVRGLACLPDGLPIGAVLGDSHAALFAQSHGRTGVVKATYGSGSSLMALTPATGAPDGVSRTIAWQVPGEQPSYALEANIAAAGTAVRWAAQLLGTDSAGITELAAHATDTDLFLVPAFSGLGAPYWDPSARALLVGLAQDTGAAEVARAAVESIAYQVADTLSRFDHAIGPVAELRCDGGPTANDQLMTFQANLLGRPVIRAGFPEISALGTAHLAGISLGLWNQDQLLELAPPRARIDSTRTQEWRDNRMRGWRDAVARARFHA